MLTSESIALAIKIAKGVIKLVNQVDMLVAEKVAVTGSIALRQPLIKLGPKQGAMIKALKKLLNDEVDLPDADRNRITTVLQSNNGNPEVVRLRKLMARYLPEQAVGRVLDLDGSFMKELQSAGFDLQDPDVRVSLFYIKAELDRSEKDYSWKIALTIVDVLTEFGGENIALFTRDEKIQGIVGSVLKRFGETDLQTADSWNGVLRKALSATLNGALDANDVVDADGKLLGAVLDGLSGARSKMPKDQRDNFLLGLFQGKGYPLLVGTLVETAATELGDDDAAAFESIAAQVLNEGAKPLKKDQEFEGFFREHWGDLLRAGFTSLKERGPRLAGNKQLVGDVVVAIAGKLSETGDRDFLTHDTIVGLVDAAVASVAANPKLLKKAARDKWLGAFVNSVVQTVAAEGVRKTFSSGGGTAIVKGALATFGEHPELIVERPGLVQELIGGVLMSVSGIDRLAATNLANAAAEGALTTILRNPDLLNLRYPELVAGFAGKVAGLVSAGSVTSIQGEDLIAVLTESVAENPKLLGDLERKLSESVLDAVLGAASGSKTGLIAGASVAELLQHVVGALARHGRAKFGEGPTVVAIGQLETLLDAGLERAESEIGSRIGLSSVPAVLGGLVSAWARGEVGEIDKDDPNFKRLFTELAVLEAAL